MFQVICYCHIFLLIARMVSATHGDALNIKPNILGPPLKNKPFVVTWNVASEECQKYGVDIDLSDFDIVHNPDKSWKGSTLTIFYGNQLGLYPRFTPDGAPVNGGLPQLANLTEHLKKVTIDIHEQIPDQNFQGLAVIDWEAWLPQLDRMTYGSRKIYRDKSLEKVKQEHPSWTKQQLLALAEFEYNTAAKMFFEQTLELGKAMRPNALWGLYLFPDCFNYKKNGTDFTCSELNKERNDKIQWLFEDSTALYPSVYLGEWFKNDKYAIDYVANRVREAVRVDYQRHTNTSIPIFAYHSIVYRKQKEFVDIVDLRDSIGISSLMGASGMVIWGDHNIANSKDVCKTLKNYIDSTLGPFCKAVSDEAAKCSEQLCHGNGRCVVSSMSTNSNGQSTRRFLDPKEASELYFSLKKNIKNVFYSDMYREKAMLGYSLVCQCFEGWQGNFCGKQW